MSVVASELIETLWNVNRELEQILGKWKPELIETLWNVNFWHILFGIFRNFELIETLWNVNLNIVPIPFVNKSN